MKDSFVFLFVVRGGRVETYRYRQTDGQPDQFELLPEEGRASRKLDAGFWTWWRNRLDVVVEESVMDFAFLSAGAEEAECFLPKEFTLSPETCWTRRAVVDFLKANLGLAEGDFVLRERGEAFCTSPRADAQVFCLRRFNAPVEAARPKRAASSLYESMRNDPYPAEFIRQIKGLQ